jgi:hypothetical protein
VITDAMVETGARAICAHTGDDPDEKTYAREMKCTGHDREPAHRWEYWAPFSRAVLTATLVTQDHPTSPVVKDSLTTERDTKEKT